MNQFNEFDEFYNKADSVQIPFDCDDNDEFSYYKLSQLSDAILSLPLTVQPIFYSFISFLKTAAFQDGIEFMVNLLTDDKNHNITKEQLEALIDKYNHIIPSSGTDIYEDIQKFVKSDTYKNK